MIKMTIKEHVYPENLDKYKHNLTELKELQRVYSTLLKEKNNVFMSQRRQFLIDDLREIKNNMRYICNKQSYKEIKLYWFNNISKTTYSYNYELRVGSSFLDRKRMYSEAKRILKQQIQEFRQGTRKIYPNKIQHYISDIGEYIKYDMVGLVHSKGGDFVKFKERKRYNEVFKYKQPRYEDKNNYVGIELEFVSPEDHDELARMFVKKNLEKYITLKHDGSIAHDDENEYSAEVAIYCKDTEYSEVVDNVLDVIRNVGGYINKSCGMHVHLDMRNRDVSKCYKNLVKSQSILYAMQPASRRKNKYCKRSNGSIFNIHGRTRYKGINNTAYSKHRTLEVRMHSGTLDYDKITNWVKLLLNIINTNETIDRAPTKLSSFIKKFNIDNELALYIAERIEKFNAVDESQQRIQENREISQEQAA